MNIITLLMAAFPWGYVKLAILIMILLYGVFAAVIVRQEQLMAKVVEVPQSPLLRLVALVHLVVAIGTLFLSFILL